MKIKNYFLAFSLTFLFGEAAAQPAQVLVIRHGEKPESGEHLSLKGQERAAALALIL